MRLLRRLYDVAGIDPDSQKGVAVVVVAVVLTLLIAVAAFAVDFGWLYLNGVRIQHGADAAALSGVVYEPGDQATAYSEAIASAGENGYDNSAAGTTVTPVDFADDPSAVENQFQLSVTIEHDVSTFFMKVFGVDSISMSRTAVAEYVLPLPMGSDLPYFGEDPSIPGRDPHFWANIHGYYTGRTMGDRYASQCLDDGDGSGCTKNGDRRQTALVGGVAVTGGYLYGIEVDDTVTSLQVQVFDGPFYHLDEPGGDYFLVGDHEQGGTPPATGPTTHFVLYGPDPTPLNTTDNPVLCHVVFPPEFTFADFDGDGDVGSRDGTDWIADPEDDQNGDGYFDWADVELGYPGGSAALWENICPGALTVSEAGVYPLRVAIEDPGTADERGLNRFSLRANTTGNPPRMFGLGDMAVYVNFEGNSSTFRLAEVYPVHAGKELVIELWDADSGNSGVEIYMPDGSLAECTWSTSEGTGSSVLAPCDLSYSPSIFNNHQMQIRIQIDPAYACTADCWWEIKVDYPGGANDTTTWSARVEGNPVSLVK